MRITASLICAVMLLASGQVLASQVTDVALHYQDGSTVAHIDIKGSVRFTHQTEEAKDGKPFRVIVDVLSATHHLPAKDFLSLPECPVVKIRTSQYSVKPEKVVRLVFDMEEVTFYRVDSDDNSISLFFPDKQRRKFAVWSSATYAATSKVAQKMATETPGQSKAVASAAQAAKSKKTVVELNQAIDDDRLFSLAGEPALASTTTEPAKKEPAPTVDKQKSTVRIKSQTERAPAAPEVRQVPVVIVDVPYGPEFDENLLKPLVSEPVVDVSGVAKDQADKPPAVREGEPAVEKPAAAPARQELPVEKILAAAPTDATAPPTPKAEAKPTGSKEQKPAATGKQAAQTTLDNKKAAVTSGQKKDQPSRPTVAKKPETETLQQRTPPPIEKKPAVDKPVPAVDKPGPALAVADNQDQPKLAKKSVQKKATTPDKAAAQKKAGETQDSTVEIKDKKDTDKKPSTSRFRRSPTRPTKIKGTLVAEFPKRLVIKYKARSSRDPFETLINEAKTYNSPIDKRIPNIEGLELVGVLESEVGANSALFEDKNGYGYILKEGDKVRKGYVLRVEHDRVYFQIFEYGWSRTVALNIDED